MKVDWAGAANPGGPFLESYPAGMINSENRKNVLAFWIVLTLLGPIWQVAASDSTLVIPPAGVSEHDVGPLQLPIVDHLLNKRDSFYFLDLDEYPQRTPVMFIGVFDSGTGGLAVLEAILSHDGFNNGDGMPIPDGVADFEQERFVFLADQANMPYGQYFSEGKEDLLIEHIFKNLHFLLSGKHYLAEDPSLVTNGNGPVKAIVIACNTATASGKRHLEAFMDHSGLGLPVFGVVDAGAIGALECLEVMGPGSIGVLATVGTVATRGYEEAILRLGREIGYGAMIRVYSQGGYGMAEAIDEDPAFYDRNRHELNNGYRGPTLNGPENFQIKRDLLEAYNFDYSGNRMLCDHESPEHCQAIQINDPVNYMRYHLVSLLESLRRDPSALPLKCLILGCTHYPYLKHEVHKILKELYHYRENGSYRYRGVLSKEVQLIDPAEKLAHELYTFLHDQALINTGKACSNNRFFISVPNRYNPAVRTDENGRFPYGYKYGRQAGEIQQYVRVVPFGPSNIPMETLDRLQISTPAVFREIIRFAPDLNDRFRGP
jgi:glutamate racemase